MPPRHGRYEVRFETTRGRVVMWHPRLEPAVEHATKKRNRPYDEHDSGRQFAACVIIDLGEQDRGDRGPDRYLGAEIVHEWSHHVEGRRCVIDEPPWFPMDHAPYVLPLTRESLGKKRARAKANAKKRKETA